MSKRFKGKTCVYCDGVGTSSTADHVFAREFIPKEKRDGLPIVAACIECNNAKAALEHYLTAVLPFGGNHSDCSALLANDVPRRLEKNQKLYRHLSTNSEKFEITENGNRVERFAVPFDSVKLEKWLAYVARGLSAYHWDTVIPRNYCVRPITLNPYFEPQFRDLFLRPAQRRIQGVVGDGAFLFEGAQGIEDPAFTMWRFQVFGGIVVAGDPDVPDAGAPTVWVLTSEREIFEQK